MHVCRLVLAEKMESRLNLVLTYSASFFDVVIPLLVQVKMGDLGGKSEEVAKSRNRTHSPSFDKWRQRSAQACVQAGSK